MGNVEAPAAISPPCIFKCETEGLAAGWKVFFV